MEKKKHYLVYKTTCLLNGKIYIGQHQTYDINDGYIGSGIELQKAIERFGRENFTREILFDFDNFTDMDTKERELVTEEFVKREDTFNKTVGGQGYDFYVALKNGLNNSADNYLLGGKVWSRMVKENPELHEKCVQRGRSIQKRHPELATNLAKMAGTAFFGRHHTEETKQKVREKNSVLLRGEHNGSFGTVWIYNESLEQNKKVKKEEAETFLKQGWKFGRRMNFHK